ncbi:hypothetical protein OIU85_004719 [Salix viminalis]|uniref:Bulb-type lectin domain-containing protein n=1 Tax=Salix viminalis TaxID=40686 RepID=A0A9Q0PT44_SALVM|nr:hypothetical protein OIU85_004719 [Salix viminalis]
MVFWPADSVFSVTMVSAVLWSLPFVLSFLGSLAQPQTTANTINLGSSMTAGTNSSWRSPSGDFAFGFYRLVNGQFLVGIWFDNIPERTLVWSANRDDPARTGSTINFTLDGRLGLTHSNGTGYLIYNGTFGASSALMQDDGNFVVKTNSSKVIWQSFHSPTDTILLGQVLVMGQKLYSNANGTIDYSTGQYMLELQTDGNVVMSAYKFADPGYWYTATKDNKNVSLIFNQSTAFMYVVNQTSIAYPMTREVPTPIGDYYHRAMINDNGTLQQFVHRKENGSGWTVVWEPDEIKAEPCIAFNNICGVYGFCTTTVIATINCTCLPGYSPLDPSIPSKGCYPDTVIDFCAPNSSASSFSLQVIRNADFPNGDFGDMAKITGVDEEACRKAIMDDCFAVAGVLNGSDCYKKRMPLLSARGSIPSTNINRVAFIKIPKANNNPPIQDKDDDSPSWIALLAGLLLCSTMALLFATITICHHPLAQPYISRKQLPVPKPVDINLKAFSFQELLQATNGLRNKLGRGAFGTVFSGVLTLAAEECESWQPTRHCQP